MSAKYTYLAWQATTGNASEKLVLLKLADLSGNDGMVAVNLQESAQECLLGEFAFADTLTALGSQGILEKVRVDSHMGKQTHIFQLTLEKQKEEVTQSSASIPATQDLMSLPPVQKGVVAPEASQAPHWASKVMSFSKVDFVHRDKVWQHFVQRHGMTTTNIYRLERQFETWLEQCKHSGELNSILNIAPPEKAKNTHYSSNKKQPQLNTQREDDYISTHDLSEYDIPEWAHKMLAHSGLETDLKIFWEKFVIYYKSRANEYLSPKQLGNKLRLWIVNEKQAQDRRFKAEERRRQSYQNTAKSNDVSPSEEFREFLREQGKKPSF